MEILDIVDNKDCVIGCAPREEIKERLLCHRIVHILIFNEQEEMALQLSSQNKAFCPGHWGTAVGGHVKSGENYEQAALRELEEELGVKMEFQFFQKDYFENIWGLPKFIVTFTAIFNGPFKVNPEELEKIEFFNLSKIQELIDNKEKFHPELLFLLEKHYGIKKSK
ncbi:MAG: NUDIX domain-containing protein [Patescibacteria group bacterium]|nr:NUDIX domain-containing protein [Patescibacteria group bacterium]